MPKIGNQKEEQHKMPLRTTCPICGAYFRAGLWRHTEECAERQYQKDEARRRREESRRIRANFSEAIHEQTKIRESFQDYQRGEGRQVDEFMRELESLV